MMALKSKLQKNAFLLSLKKKSSKNFVEIQAQAKKYTDIKEGYKAHLVPAEANTELKLGSSKLAPTGRANLRN